MQARTSRLGWILFSVYLILYAGFVLLNAFAPAAMEATPLGGLNLAILYGFGLIIGAFILAVLYGVFGHDVAEDDSQDKEASA